MTVGLLIDAAARFPLGARNGVVTPTTEPVSDTAVTPFGLTLRTIPAPGNVVRAADEATGTSKVTTHETDGSGDGADTQVDFLTDDD